MNVSPSYRDPSTLRAQYAACRAGLAEGVRITLLHIGADETILMTGTSVEVGEVVDALSLPLGTNKIADRHFHHTPPTPEEMEDAIMTVEDVLASISSAIPRDTVLMSADPGLREIAALAGVSGSSVTLHRDAVEQTFDRLAGVVLGRPATSEGIPANRDYAARLLILREFMHHLGFERIVLSAG